MQTSTSVPIHALNQPFPDQSWEEVESSGMLQVISHYNLALALTAIYQVGLHKKLNQGQQLDYATATEGLNPKLTARLLHYLSVHGLIHITAEHYQVTPRGRAMLSEPALAQLGFYTESYGPIVSQIAALLEQTVVYGDGVERDGRALGEHCATLFREYHTNTMLKAMADIKGEKILDLGCGGGQFLVDACEKSATLQGIGLDNSAPAIDFARRLAIETGLTERLDFVVGDAFNLNSWPEEAFSADVLCAHGVLHEHFRDGEEAVIHILNTYAELLKGNFKAFVLGEPELRYDLEKSDSDLYLIHIFTAQGFPRRREEWLKVIDRSNLKCVNIYTRPNAGPRFNFFELVNR